MVSGAIGVLVVGWMGMCTIGLFYCPAFFVLSCSLSFTIEGAASLAAALRAHPGSLTSLVGVQLSAADPLLPLEFKQSYNGAILDFYRDLQLSAVISRRCRVMLLGAGGVGKTTLANRVVTGASSSVAAHVTHGALQRRCSPFQHWCSPF